jgi:hypothetical protein
MIRRRQITYEFSPQLGRDLHKRSEGSANTVQLAGPFTADWLREKIQARGCCVPPDCELVRLADLLNKINAAYKNSANLALSAEARYAVWALLYYFDTRRQACGLPPSQLETSTYTGAPVLDPTGVDPLIIERELELCDQFDGFVKAMFAHTYALDMDAGLLMRPYKTWRNFDHWIAHGFVLALAVEASNRGKIGFTNKGPIAWFTNEAIEVVTGKAPGAYNVGQHLKQPHGPKGKQRRLRLSNRDCHHPR